MTLTAHLHLVSKLIVNIAQNCHSTALVPSYCVHTDSLKFTFAESQASHRVSGPLRPERSPSFSKKLLIVACPKPFQSCPRPHIVTLDIFFNIIVNIKMDLKNEELKCGCWLI